MYQDGVRCVDCHNPHTIKLKAEGNALCVQCHSERADRRFPKLIPKVYDTPLDAVYRGGKWAVTVSFDRIEIRSHR
jgi:predicted CXXCH cytochrome family protein